MTEASQYSSMFLSFSVKELVDVNERDDAMVSYMSSTYKFKL